MMAPPAAGENVARQSVGMGQIVVARGQAGLAAILGSCVGVVLYHAGLKLGAMAHVVLPDSHGRGNASSPGKFADSAVPAMVALLRGLGAAPTELIAKIAGGAGMFGSGGPWQIGQLNTQAVVAVLAAAGIPIVGRDVGGSNGRRATLDCSTGTVTVITGNGRATVI